MEVKDVRFKNLVLLDGIETEIDITQIMNFAFWEKHEKEFYGIRWQPIPLTEEWILKFGFICEESKSDVWFHPKHPLFEIRWYAEYEYQHLWDGSYTGAQIQYVHQLQNLYFALTGEELILP